MTGVRKDRGYNHSMKALARRAQRILTILDDEFGVPRWDPKPPVDELVSTILSQNTNDANRDRAFTALRSRFSSWDEVLAAPEGDLLAAIRPAGLGPQKAPRIRAALAKIKEERGRIELDFLRRMDPERARTWLIALPGVGPKTAAIVMLFSLGMPAFPVDTHVHRVSGRLGLRPERMSADAAHEHLAGLFSSDRYAAAHLQLIRLGRETCHARAPVCARCPLRRTCPFPRQKTGSGRRQ